MGEVIHWQCEQRGVCKFRVHTKGMQIIKRTNEHLSSYLPGGKIAMKRKASETQDSSHLILGDSLLTVSEGVSGKLPKLTSLTALFSVNGSEYLSTSTSFSTTLVLDQRESSSSRRNATSRCWIHPSTGLLMGPSKLLPNFSGRSM